MDRWPNLTVKKFYLTTPLYYPNARPHVGNSYTTMVCDAIARYKRLCGYDVAYLTGTDEHGEKLQRAAAEAGMSPPEFVASKREIFYRLWEQLEINYSHFIYTDRADHVKSVQRILLRARANGYIDKRRYEGRYCVSDERYISDGTEPADCDICGRPAELISEENYFFRLSAFQDRLLELYEKHPEFVLPDFRRNEVLSFVKSGLRDISVSRRRIKWGIPWPDDPEQVFYVWYDALTGYMTGIGFAEGESGSAEFRKYWPADCHMVGKDIIRFHAVYWPAFLMAADLPVPRTIFAHGWLTVGVDKMSKSKGNVVYCEPIVEALDSLGAPGADALRYYLMRDIPFGQDSSFTYDGLIRRYNSDLANDLGNLASRAITMMKRYFDGRVPTTSEPLGVGSRFPFLAIANGAKTRYERHLEAYELSKALEDVWHLIGTVNQYLNDLQPWAIADDPSKKGLLANVLCTAYEALRFVTVLAHPFIPESSQKLWEQLGQKGRVEDFRIDNLDWANVSAGVPVGKPEAIFPRLDKDPTLRKLAELAEADRARAQVPTKKEVTKPVEEPTEQKISIEDFAKVEMRTGEIRSAEAVPGAQKLLKLMVDIGTEVRQVVAGIAGYYKPEDIVGMKVVLVTNLQPRKLRGVESNGMIVAATVGEEGRPVLVTFKEDVPNGARLK
jgi:methionyl-tRNA synthetase